MFVVKFQGVYNFALANSYSNFLVHAVSSYTDCVFLLYCVKVCMVSKQANNQATITIHSAVNDMSILVVAQW